jgi:ABC-type spermidine/putrescine transport system permease subunit I
VASEARAAGRVPAQTGGGVWFPSWFWPSFAAPASIWLIVLFVVPFYVILSIAFGGVDPIFLTPEPVYNPVGWDASSFVRVASGFTTAGSIYQGALLHTAVFVAAATALCLVIGYPVAYFIARHAGRFRAVFLVALIAPFWISYMMRMLAWINLLQPDGYVPYMILPLFAFLDRISTSSLEASRDLGAGPAATFRRVTLPQSRQAILAGIVIVMLPMFGDYFTTALLASTRNTAMIGSLIVSSMGSSLVQEGASLVLLLLLALIAPMLYYLRSTTRAVEGATL